MCQCLLEFRLDPLQVLAWCNDALCMPGADADADTDVDADVDVDLDVDVDVDVHVNVNRFHVAFWTLPFWTYR